MGHLLARSPLRKDGEPTYEGQLAPQKVLGYNGCGYPPLPLWWKLSNGLRLDLKLLKSLGRPWPWHQKKTFQGIYPWTFDGFPDTPHTSTLPPELAYRYLYETCSGKYLSEHSVNKSFLHNELRKRC